MIEAADAAAKAAKVQLIELRLAMALGGKAFDADRDVAAARGSGCGAVVAAKGLLVNKVRF
jgi:microcompartment protein CcmL/EutN